MPGDPDEDKSLMLRFQGTGDVSAFRTLFSRHKEPLLAYLRRLAGRVEVAEDVSQQAWLKLLEVGRKGAYRPSESASFRTFLFTLARNHYMDRFVRAHEARVARLDAKVEGALPDERESPDDATATMQIGPMLDAALRELPHEQRDVVALWSVGIDIDTISVMVDAPRDTVMSRKKYALAKLRQALARQGVEET